jgi:peptidoglycan/xylan/chitin deacetylase (PgdA/CDA1 family)
VTATFFVVGDQLLRHPDLGRLAVERGHELAVHGWNHRPLPGRRPGRISGELADTCELITAVAGVAPRWYRPPYGVATGEALWASRRLGLRPVWWHRWGRDWSRRAGPAGIARAVIGPPERPRLHSGNVILLHDSDTYGTPGSWRSTAAALPAILEHAGRNGLRVSSLGAPTSGERSWSPPMASVEAVAR